MRPRTVYKQRYKKGVAIREDLAHLVNANTMAMKPQMIESGVIEMPSIGERMTYHDVRLFFPASPMHR